MTMSLPVLIIIIAVGIVLLGGFAALMVAVMTSKKSTGHHGPRSGHADKRPGKKASRRSNKGGRR
ncbi:MAG: hypothetical protein RIB60_06680 [Phycisphaerales bacterium]